jgi:hypothetical protein
VKRTLVLVLFATACAPGPFLSGPYEGDPCQYSDDCVSGLCLDLGDPSGIGVCTRRCERTSECPGHAVHALACVSGRCIPRDTEVADFREPCGAVGPAEFGACRPGLICAGFGDWLPTCTRFCTSDASCGGTACVAVGAGDRVCAIHL